MAKLKRDTDVKDEMYSRVKRVYGVFILVALLVVVRLVWVSAFSSETAYNAERLERRIFIVDSVYSRRGSILARDGEPLATSILRYRVDFDMASDGFDSLALFREQADSGRGVPPPHDRGAQQTLPRCLPQGYDGAALGGLLRPYMGHAAA